MSDRMRKGARRNRLLWITLAALFVFSRMLILYSPSLYEGMPFRRQPDLEEFTIGNIAMELIRGPIEPVSLLKDRPYEGDTIVNGFLAVPFFFLLGQNYAALKMTALVFSLGTLIALTVFTYRELGKWPARLVFFLYFLPPPGVIRFSLWSTGHYPQSQLITFLILIFFFPLLFPRAKNAPPSRPFLALSGLICGLGLYFHPYLAITVTYCILLAIVFRRELLKPIWSSIFLATLVLGVGLSQVGNIVRIHDYVYFPRKMEFWTVQNLYAAFIRLKILFGSFLWRIWNYSDASAALGALLNKAFYILISAVYLALWMLVCRSGVLPRHSTLGRKSLALLLFVPVFTCFFVLSPIIDVWTVGGTRFLMVLVPFIFIYLALFLSRLIEQNRSNAGKAAGAAIIAALALLNLTAFVRMVGPLGQGDWKMRAVWMEALGQYIGRNHLGENPNPVLRKIATQRKGEDRIRIMQGFFDIQLSSFRNERDIIEKAVHYLTRIDEPSRAEGCLALGRLLADLELATPEKIAWAETLGTLPPALKMQVARGMGSQLGWRLVGRYGTKGGERFQAFEEIASKMDPESRQGLYYGLGSVLSWKYRPRTFKRGHSAEETFFEQEKHDEVRLEEFAQFVPPDVRRAFIGAQGNNLYYRFVEW